MRNEDRLNDPCPRVPQHLLAGAVMGIIASAYFFMTGPRMSAGCFSC